MTTKVSKRVSQNSCCHGVPSWFERHVMPRFHDGVVMVVSVRKSVLLSWKSSSKPSQIACIISFGKLPLENYPHKQSDMILSSTDFVSDKKVVVNAALQKMSCCQSNPFSFLRSKSWIFFQALRAWNRLWSLIFRLKDKDSDEYMHMY